eukprot:409292_1
MGLCNSATDYEEVSQKSDSLKDIDYALYKYYCSMNSDYISNKSLYYNKNNVGKIQTIMFERGFDEDEVDIEYAAQQLSKDEHFPMNTTSLNKDERKLKILEILKYCFHDMYHYDDDADGGNINTSNNSDETENECRSMVKCKSLSNIIDILQCYQHTDEIEDMMDFRNLLVSDYHHILDVHLNNVDDLENEQNFQIIHDSVAGQVKCNITQCRQYLRNNRIRGHEEKQMTASELTFVKDLLDTIHVTFIHSFDAGFRVHNDFHKNHVDTQLINDDTNFKDPEFSKLFLYLKEKRRDMFAMRRIEDNSGYNKNKFVTD